LGFENIFRNRLKEGINGSECVLSSKDRPHISKAKIDLHSNARYVDVRSFAYAHYMSELDERYIAATSLTYDLLFSMHDVNSRRSIIYRPFQDADLLDTTIKRKMEAWRKANIEARIIGLQNKQEFDIIQKILDFIIANNMKLVEVDLFGSNTRHVAIDAKLGMSLNILMEDRIYRPGELVNPMTIENFEAALAAGSATIKKAATDKDSP